MTRYDWWIGVSVACGMALLIGGGGRPASGQSVATLDLEEIAAALRADPQPATVHRFLPSLLASARDAETSAAAHPVLEQAIEVLEPAALAEPSRAELAALLRASARIDYDQFTPIKASQDLERWLAVYRAAAEREPVLVASGVWPRQLIDVAGEYLRGDQLEKALDVLGEAAAFGEADSWAEPRSRVSAALNRRLESLSTAERFELLHDWALPQEGRESVRVWTSLTPVEAPPSVFARALGERPRDDSFAVPRINGLPGLFSLEWQLVDAAEQSGQLRRLKSELEELAERGTAGAEYVLLLARIRDAGAERDPELLAELTRMLENNALLPPQIAPELARAVIASACIGRSWLQPFALDALAWSRDATRLDDSQRLHAFYRRAAAEALLRTHPEARRDLFDEPGLRDWIPAVVDGVGPNDQGGLQGVWAAHEGHVLHSAAADDDYLCFRYPLSGNFRFRAEVQTGGVEGQQGHIRFGGYTLGPSGTHASIALRRLGQVSVIEKPFVFIRRESWPAYQRLELVVEGDDVQWRLNGHPVRTEATPESVGPWLAIGAAKGRSAIFRNLQISGEPAIAREVPMVEGEELRGWYSSIPLEGVQQQWTEAAIAEQAIAERAIPERGIAERAIAERAIAERQPAFEPSLFQVLLRAFTAEPAAVEPAANAVPGTHAPQTDAWTVEDGVIHAACAGAFASPAQSRLAYFRPLQAGESVGYEFFYEPDQHAVHPALGRVAFLLQPSGVQLHWITSGDNDWSGLAESNSVADPLARRGPRQLPLVAGDWNRVTLAMVGENAMTLTLNDTVIYERTVEPNQSRAFGFYHDRRRSAVEIRNVVLRGDWPERLADEDRGDRFVALDSPVSDAERRANADLFAERHIADSALDVHRRAMELSDEERYALLSHWVLPGRDHPELRLTLDFTPTHPAPPVADHHRWDARRIEIAAEAGQSRIPIGGNLVAPALDLIDVASELDKLDEVRRQIEQAPDGDAYHQRARLAMLALVDIAAEDFPRATESLFTLFNSLQENERTEFAQRWPETLVLERALVDPQTRVPARELAFHLFLRQARNGAPSGSETWRRYIGAMAGLARRLDEETGDQPVAGFTAPPALTQWTSSSHCTAFSRGMGFPREHWQWGEEGVTNLATHNREYLYFQSPLRGEFEVQGEVPAFGWRDTHLLVGGHWSGLLYTRDTYEHGSLRFSQGRRPLPPPLVRVGRWLSYRVVVGEGQSTTYVNGRELHQEPLGADHAPWIAVRAPRENAAVRNLRIVGQPEIPEELRLTATPNLDGWIPYFDFNGVGGPQSVWHPDGSPSEGGGIRGLHRPQLVGTSHESLLRYQRPMLEDGTIEYDFYYREGSTMCHPALDRLAFMLGPEGVRTHWITDGAFDRTALPPDNASELLSRESGGGEEAASDPLPLKDDAWNHLSLTLIGDTVHLNLNGQPICKRVLEGTNQRSFGLFHYADQTEAHVRRVTWRGEWPRELPPLAEQELANDQIIQLDERLPELTAVFEHDFAEEDLPANQFSLVNGVVPDQFQLSAGGLHVQQQGAAGYRSAILAPRLVVQGDFDVTVAYDNLVTEAGAPGAASLILMAMFDDPAKQECMLYRRQDRDEAGVDTQYLQTATRNGDQTGRVWSPAEPFEATAGKLRIARRGKLVYFLAAEGDSSLYRLLRIQEVTDSDIPLQGLRVLCQMKTAGKMGVDLKSLTIRAESLSGFALQDIDEAARDLDRQRGALAEQFVHDFSRDSFTAARFHHWGFAPSPQPQATGQRVTERGTVAWKSSGASPHVSLSGDFDVSFQFDVLRIDQPIATDASTIYLQIEFPGADQLQCNVLMKAMPNGQKQAAVQLRKTNPDGSHNYPTVQINQVESVQRMRMARRGNELFFLYAEEASDPDRLFARYEVPEAELPDAAIRLMVHSGGEGRVTDMLWKRLTIQAENITEPPARP